VTNPPARQETTSTLPRVADYSPLIPWGVSLPTFSLKNTLAGVAYYREFGIPVTCDDAFWKSYKADKAAWARRGFRVSCDERSGKVWKVEQWLRKGDDGYWTLTPMGAKIYRELIEQQQEKAAPIQKQSEFTLIENLELPDLPEDVAAKLKTYQVTPVKQVLRALLHGRKEWGFPGACNLSGTGLGKTYMTVAAYMALLKHRPEISELTVLCPPAARAEWHQCFKYFGTPTGGITLETYEAIRGNWRAELVSRDPASGLFRWKSPRTNLLVMDEAHAVRHDDTLTFEVCAAAIAQGMHILVCSATMATSPLEFRFAGRILGLHSGGRDWERFLWEHGCSKSAKGKWSWRNHPDDIKKIHRKLFPARGVRVTAEDAGADAPETHIALKLVGGPDVEEAFRKRREAMEIRMAHIEQEHGRAKAEAFRKSHVTRMWMDEEHAAVVAAIPAMKEALARGESVTVFCNFDESRKIAGAALNCKHGVHGKANEKQKQLAVAEFQANRLRVLVNNLKSAGAGVSMHDTTGDHPRRAFIFITPDAVKFMQTLGRVARINQVGASHQEIYAVKGGITEGFAKNMRKRIANIQTLNDGTAVKLF
jgi:hypothetical protein